MEAPESGVEMKEGNDEESGDTLLRLQQLEELLKRKDEEIGKLRRDKRIRTLKLKEALAKVALMSGLVSEQPTSKSAGNEVDADPTPAYDNKDAKGRPNSKGATFISRIGDAVRNAVGGRSASQTRPQSAVRGSNKILPVGTYLDISSDPPAAREKAEKARQKIEKEDAGIRYRPMLGAVYPPTELPYIDPTAPASSLELCYVFGVNGAVHRNNIFFLGNEREVVYFIAGCGIVYNLDTRQQRHFLEHTNDILCLALHPDGHTVATGQQDPIGSGGPFVLIWDAYTMVSTVKLENFHQRGVFGVAFSPTGTMLASVGGDDRATLAIVKWMDSPPAPLLGCSTAAPVSSEPRAVVDTRLVGTVQLGADAFNLVFDPSVQCGLAASGVRLLKFVYPGKSLAAVDGTIPFENRSGKLGSLGAKQEYSCLAYGSDGTLYVGCADGDVYIVRGQTVVDKFKAHLGKVGGLFTVPQAAPDATSVLSGTLATVGFDGQVKLWDCGPNGWVVLESATLRSSVPGDDRVVRGRSIHTRTGREWVVSTAGNELYLVTLDANDSKDGGCRLLIPGVGGEVWGLDTHPSRNEFVTGSDDKLIKIWDMNERRLLSVISGSAQARCVAFRPDGIHLAVGFFDGTITIFDYENKNSVCRKEDRWEYIQCLCYSPDQRYLAAGSGENFIDIYDIEADYRRVAVLRGHSSYITAIDWTSDSRMLRSCSGDYELLHWWIETKKLEGYTSSLRNVEWANQRCKLGWPVIGIWSKGTDGTDINCVSRNNTGLDLIATADDSAKIKLFNWPVAIPYSEFNEYRGHSSHVTSLEFSFDDKYLLSTGGMDMAVCMWKINKKPRSSNPPTIVLEPGAMPVVIKKAPNPRSGRKPRRERSSGIVEHDKGWVV